MTRPIIRDIDLIASLIAANPYSRTADGTPYPPSRAKIDPYDLERLLNAPLAVRIHVRASFGFIIGTWADFFSRKGAPLHRLFGWRPISICLHHGDHHALGPSD